MQYRLRNLRTGEVLDAPPNDAMTSGIAPEWVLEFSAVETYDESGNSVIEWMPSSYHTKDITGVQDPRSLSELVPVLKNVGVS